MKVVIVDYGAGNVFSVSAAFERLGIQPEITGDPTLICSADRVVFPGVGHASAAMEQLKKSGLDSLLPSLKQPVLGICLGMQLMCRSSEEGNTSGLHIFDDVDVIRFEEHWKIPHMGWNTLQDTRALLQNMETDMYFVHSYYAPLSKYSIATAEYGITFSAALQKDNFIGCQFHPEKSASGGEVVLKRFIEWKK